MARVYAYCVYLEVIIIGTCSVVSDSIHHDGHQARSPEGHLHTQ